jgi:hypothetical protein
MYNIDSEIAQVSKPGGDLLDDPADREAAKLEAGQQLTARRTRGVEVAKTLEHMQYQAANLQNIIEHGGQLRYGWEGVVLRV